MLLEGLRGYRGYPGGFRAYRRAFPTVELSWWHRVGDPRTIGRLKALAPTGFRFSVHGHKHLSYRPSGEERRVLRRFLRRFRLFGPKAGAVRLEVPEGVEPEAFASWLDLLEEVLKEVGPVALAFQVAEALKPLVRGRGYALVNEAGGPFLYLVDPEGPLPEGEGYLYRRHPSQAAPSALHSRAEVDPG
ncbi:MAG: DUF72 domain-containing protein [Thermus sp.]|uniref:DUF72 domain-containing protein n=1 Tax=unclassified Thermus TaxID=2619321 RepID=UPI0002389C7D|nr:MULTISPECIES: DUF72 domain-containing protein [unclassified Thermus]AEV15412.1 hypothetical protein TCCBUS3UF1_3640 [Thermus sp. CCB_US3_UF1]MCS7218624.1 DUF72 domain-containing protein [Thermus sp.]